MIKAENNGNNQGITLIALTITIITLIILAAVTINVLFRENILDVAAKTAEDYEKAQYQEKEEFQELENKLEDGVQGIIDMGNRNKAPIFINDGTIYSSNANEVIIKASATDADEDKLTYKLNWGETEELENTYEKIIETSDTEEVELNMTELSGTTYYYRVDVTDGKNTTEGTIKIANKCNGPFNNHVSCEHCRLFWENSNY